MIKLYYQNECSLEHWLCSFWGRRGDRSKSSFQRLVAKFETTGPLKNQPTPVRQRNARSAENIAAVRESVQDSCARTRPFVDFNLANFASVIGPESIQGPTNPGAQS
ncbi:hypothetical protein Trydic_g22468 [Trypoxylus dichotomus]